MVEKGIQGYDMDTLLKSNPRAMELRKAVEKASADGTLLHLHSQVFLNKRGFPNSQAGNGTGTQLNRYATDVKKELRQQKKSQSR